MKNLHLLKLSTFILTVFCLVKTTHAKDTEELVSYAILTFVNAFNFAFICATDKKQ